VTVQTCFHAVVVFHESYGFKGSVQYPYTIGASLVYWMIRICCEYVKSNELG
jgi:hypothetical protein